MKPELVTELSVVNCRYSSDPEDLISPGKPLPVNVARGVPDADVPSYTSK